MKKLIAFMLAAAMVLCLFSGCGSTTAATEETSVAASETAPAETTETAETAETEQPAEVAAEETAQEEAAPEETAAEPEEYGTVVIENGDRTVTFTAMPTGVLCANLYSAENMVMLGLGEYIVCKNVHTNPAEVPLDELADAFENIPEIERSNENAVASGCDLLIGQVSAFKDTAWGTYEQLESEGISCLTITGAAMQSLVLNPIADPYILGISSGASAGAALALLAPISFLAGQHQTTAFAFIGALASAFIVYFFAKRAGGGKLQPVTLLLSGTAANAVMSAITSFLIFRAKSPEGIAAVYSWQMGSISASQ